MPPADPRHGSFQQPHGARKHPRLPKTLSLPRLHQTKQPIIDDSRSHFRRTRITRCKACFCAWSRRARSLSASAALTAASYVDCALFSVLAVRLHERPLGGLALGPHALLRLRHGGLDFALMLGVERVHVGAMIRQEFLLARL